MPEEGSGDDSKRRRFYDVDAFTSLLKGQRSSSPPTGLSRALRQVSNALDFLKSLFTAFVGVPIMLGGLAVPIIGLVYGPLVFLAVGGGFLAAVAFYVDRKVGKHLIFGEYDILKRALAQAVAFGMFLGILLLIIFVTGTFRP